MKFRNNPQGVRVLANEMLASRLAAAAGLTVPACDVIEVTDWLVQNTGELMMEFGQGRRERCVAGLQFGSQFVGGLMPGRVVDYLPENELAEVRNLSEFWGMLCVDKWAGNCNGRQAVFERSARERKYRAHFVDQGFCFNAGEWTFPDSPLRGVFARNVVYERVTGWKSFEPWLSRIEGMEAAVMWEIAEAVPPDWYGGDLAEMERLVEQMLTRRKRVRDLIAAFRDSDRQPFPLWDKKTTVAVPRMVEGAEVTGKYLM